MNLVYYILLPSPANKCSISCNFIISKLCDTGLISETSRSSPPEVFSYKVVVKIYSTFAGEHPCGSVISRKLLCKFIEITLPYRCSPINLLHIFKATFCKNTFEKLLLDLGGNYQIYLRVSLLHSFMQDQKTLENSIFSIL